MDRRTLARTYLVFPVNGISGTDASSRPGTHRTIVTPASTSLSVRTVTSHVACITAGAANDTRGVVLLLGTIVLAVANLTTILASLVFVVAKGTVQSSKLTQLVALQFILTFGDRCGL